MKQETVFNKNQIPKNLTELGYRIKQVMVDHVGVKKEITKMELFKKLFGNPSKYNELQEFYIWDKIKKGMNLLRRSSDCFIGSRRVHTGIWAYFVIANNSDLKYYKFNLRANINKMYRMIDRGQKLVDQQAYKKYLSEMKKDRFEV